MTTTEFINKVFPVFPASAVFDLAQPDYSAKALCVKFEGIYNTPDFGEATSVAAACVRDGIDCAVEAQVSTNTMLVGDVPVDVDTVMYNVVKK